MMRNGMAGVATSLALCGLVVADEKLLVQRGGIMGREFSEVGRLYVDDDELIHFRTDQRLYYFSHMVYVWDALEAAGVVRDGGIACSGPVRITGNYSKAQSVYNFLEEPALRGSQIMWIDRVERVQATVGGRGEAIPLFVGESLDGWSVLPADASDDPAGWTVDGGVLGGSSRPGGGTQTVLSGECFSDFELTFEYRAPWGTSASLLLRADEEGGGIALAIDHVDEGTIGFPKSAAGATRPFMLYETREERGVGAGAHVHVQFDGRSDDDALGRGGLLQCGTLGDFLNAWDGAFWNLVRVRCVGGDPEVTLWINGFQVCGFKASGVAMTESNPPPVGAVEGWVVHSSGRIGFALHSAPPGEPGLLLREVRVRRLD